MVDYASLKDALRGLAGALFGLFWLLPSPAVAQAPFATDDAGVTPAGAWHFELFLSEADLQPLDRPATGQTTLVASAAYGLFGRLELGIDAPWIAIDQAGEPGIRLKQKLLDKLVEHKRYIEENGQDLPEIRDWRWDAPDAGTLA